MTPAAEDDVNERHKSPFPLTDKFDENDINLKSSNASSVISRKNTAEIPLSTVDSHNNSQMRSTIRDAKRRRAVKRKGDKGNAFVLDQPQDDCGDRRAAMIATEYKKTLRHSAKDASITSLPNDQYRIPPRDEHVSVLDALLHLCSLGLEDLASWVYAASFWMVLFFFLALYLLFVWIFVAFLLAADKYSDAQCIANGDMPAEDIVTRRHILEFAFALSWTTFTTVGFGRIAPSVDEVDCYPVRFICSIEAILGMGFVSMCSGIFYAKLLKFIGSAPVTFSSSLCVQYGKGLCERKAGLSFRKRKGEDLAGDINTFVPMPLFGRRGFNPFPVLEFRIVNNRANCPPGKNEIWDAQVKAIVNIRQEDGECTVGKSLVRYPSNRKSHCDLKLSPSSHPFFCRTWIVQHVLDETSPLLKEDVRKHLKERGPDRGWDASLNNYIDIRNAMVEFTSVRIMLSGSSALSKGEVYAEKTYNYDDMFIGWKFVGICIEDEDEMEYSHFCGRSKRRTGVTVEETKIRVDLSLLHDICPQKGGNYEPMETTS